MTDAHCIGENGASQTASVLQNLSSGVIASSPSAGNCAWYEILICRIGHNGI